MDTSETYIKMCDCPEIQLQIPISRDWGNPYYEPRNFIADRKRGSLFNEDDGYYYPTADKDAIVWLPRQDQLQEMVESTCPVDLLTRFQRWVAFDEEDSPDDSMEQLWLAFVMKEKHNKIWNGEVWDEITN